MTSTERIVDVQAASAALGGRPVLHDVDLRVGRGEVVTLLGANGSGKSTVVRAVLGLVPLNAGSVSLFGTPLAAFRQWRRVGYVPQRVSAASGVPATVREVVAAGRLSRIRPFARFGRADRAAVDAALDVVSMDAYADEGVGRLSGGQQQRVLIARALAGTPDLLVLDEPMAGVDAVSQQAVADALQRLVVGGASILLVLHELGQLAPLIDRAVVLRDGRVGYDGAVPPDTASTPTDADHDLTPPPGAGFGLTGSLLGPR